MANIKSFPNNQDVFIGAEEVMKWLHGRTSGVFGAEGNAAVSAVQGEMSVYVSDGIGWLSNEGKDGIVWWNDHEEKNGEKLKLSVSIADSVLNRVDFVVVEWKTTDYTDLPHIRIVTGTPSSGHVEPILINTETMRQICLARIVIPAGSTEITASMITDTRLNPAYCGIVTESAVVDTSMASAQFDELLKRVEDNLEQILVGQIADESITVKKLSNEVKEFVSAYNLLDNSDFSNPVDQRGKSTYIGEAGYTIDRWKTTNKLNVARLSDCIELTCTSTTAANGFTQPFEVPPDAGTPLTLAVMEADGTLNVGSIEMPSSGNVTAFQSNSGLTGRVYTDRVSLLVDIGKSVYIKWAALYVGEYTAETLPNYRPKGYTAELAACQRCFRVLRNASGYVSSINAYIFAPYNMRTTPTATAKRLGSVRTQGKSVTPTSVSETIKYIGEGIRLTMPGEYGSSNHAAALYDAEIWLSADYGEV